jgi:Zn-dependent membrane protease YugP
VRLQGDDCNRDGIGARVILESEGLVQIREVQGGKGHFNSQPSIPVEFGLGQRTSIDSLRVRWPCGTEETYTGAQINQFVLAQEGVSEVTVE